MKNTPRFLSQLGTYVTIAFLGISLAACDNPKGKSGEKPILFQETDQNSQTVFLISLVGDALGNDFSHKVFNKADNKKLFIAHIQLNKTPEKEIILNIQSSHSCTPHNDCAYAIFEKDPETKKMKLMNVFYGQDMKVLEGPFDTYKNFKVITHRNIETWGFVKDSYGNHLDVIHVDPLP